MTAEVFKLSELGFSTARDWKKNIRQWKCQEKLMLYKNIGEVNYIL